MGKEVVKQEKRRKESPVSTVSVILDRIHPLGDGRLVGQKVPKGGRCAGVLCRKERGSGTSLSKAEGSRGEVSLLSTNPAPGRAKNNQTRQGFRLSSSTLLPQTLGLYRQARGFCEGWTNHVKGQIVICHSCTNHIKGQIIICI